MTMLRDRDRDDLGWKGPAGLRKTNSNIADEIQTEPHPSQQACFIPESFSEQ